MLTAKYQTLLNIKEAWNPIFKPNPPTDNPAVDKLAEAHEDWINNQDNVVKIELQSEADLKRLITPSKIFMKVSIHRVNF